MLAIALERCGWGSRLLWELTISRRKGIESSSRMNWVCSHNSDHAEADQQGIFERRHIDCDSLRCANVVGCRSYAWGIGSLSGHGISLARDMKTRVKEVERQNVLIIASPAP